MMLDSSALVAIVCREHGYEQLVEKIIDAEQIFVTAPIVFEAAMVLTIKLKRDGLAILNDFFRESGVEFPHLKINTQA